MGAGIVQVPSVVSMPSGPGARIPAIFIPPVPDPNRVVGRAYLFDQRSGRAVEFQRRAGSPHTWWYHAGVVMDGPAVVAYGVTVGYGLPAVDAGVPVWLNHPPTGVVLATDLNTERITEGPSTLRAACTSVMAVPRRSRRSRFTPDATGGL